MMISANLLPKILKKLILFEQKIYHYGGFDDRHGSNRWTVRLSLFTLSFSFVAHVADVVQIVLI